MVKRLCITVREYVFDTYLVDNRKNMSAYIEKLIVLGSESLLNKDTINKKILIGTLEDNKKLLEENSRLKIVLANYKVRFEKKESKELDKGKLDERKRKENMLRSLKNARLD